MNKQTEYIVIKSCESFWSSLCSDVVTFGFMLLCIYVSRGSRTWTFIAGCMFLLFLAGKCRVAHNERTKKFNCVGELAAWAQKQAAQALTSTEETP